jgi:predicted SAM-dependent methyltransferase
MKRFIKSIPVVNQIACGILGHYKNHKAKVRLKEVAKNMPCKIVVGSSGVFEEGWTPTDIEHLNLLNTKDWLKYFHESAIDAILSEHVWEHLSLSDGLLAAQNCFKYLKPGGYIRIAVPDGFHPRLSYIESVKVNGSGPGADDHKVLYDYESLSKLLKNAGFEVHLLEYFDEKNKFHYVDWLVADGMIHRSKRFDGRNIDGNLNYTSLIIDAIKPVK